MIEILATAEMAEADRLTIAGGIAGLSLMENAGSAVAEAVAATAYRQSGRRPRRSREQWWRRFCRRQTCSPKEAMRCNILLVGAPEKLKGDAAASAKAWNGPIAAGGACRRLGAPTSSSMRCLAPASTGRSMASRGR